LINYREYACVYGKIKKYLGKKKNYAYNDFALSTDRNIIEICAHHYILSDDTSEIELYSINKIPINKQNELFKVEIIRNNNKVTLRQTNF
jgi:hypothetical protein